MTLLDSLSAYWKLDEASGHAIDAHTNGLNLLWFANEPGTGTGLVYPTARQFVTADLDDFGIADSPLLSAGAGTSFSFIVHVKMPTRPAGNVGILTKDDITFPSREFNLYYTGTANSNRFMAETWSANGSGYIPITSSVVVADNTWYFLAVTFDHTLGSNQFKLTVNATTGSATQSQVWDGTSPFRIGGFSGSGSLLNVYQGLVGPAAFWKRALTASEVTQLYNGGSGLAYSSFAAGGAWPPAAWPYATTPKANWPHPTWPREAPTP